MNHLTYFNKLGLVIQLLTCSTDGNATLRLFIGSGGKLKKVFLVCWLGPNIEIEMSLTTVCVGAGDGDVGVVGMLA